MMIAIKKQIQNENVLYLFLALTIVFLAISPTLKSICILVATGLILMTPAYHQRLYFMFTQRCSIAAVLIFAVAVLACFWSSASYYEQFSLAEKYSKLLYLPILAVGFSNKKARSIGIHTFLLVAFILCIISILKSLGIVHSKAPDPGAVFHDHIVTGYMIAFAAYLAGLYFLRSSDFKQFFYLSLALLFSYQVLFVNTGRTGYVVYFILVALFFVENFSAKRLLVGLSIYSLLVGGAIYTTHSNAFTGLDRAVQDVYAYRDTIGDASGAKNTSVGFRLQFHEYAKSLFFKSPWIGHGTGGFSSHFREDNPIPAWGPKLIDPHSQYWLILSDFGLLGLVTLTCFFIYLGLISFQLLEMKAILQALLIPFFFANVSDAFLTHTGIGYLFIIFSGLCLGEFVENNYPIKLKSSKV